MTTERLGRPEMTAFSVDDLLREARRGRLLIPQFRRNFRWSALDMLRLFDSVCRGYPIGTLLFWETDASAGAAPRFGPFEGPRSSGPAYVVVDGQQRLTTLVGALLFDPATRGARRRQFRLYCDLSRTHVHALRAGQQPAPDDLPLADVADTQRYLAWLRGRDAELRAAADSVVAALREYRLTVCIVRSLRMAREVFERLNAGGVGLPGAAIFDALGLPPGEPADPAVAVSARTPGRTVWREDA